MKDLMKDFVPGFVPMPLPIKIASKCLERVNSSCKFFSEICVPLSFFVMRSGVKVFTAQATFSGAAIVTQSTPDLKAAKPAKATAPT